MATVSTDVQGPSDGELLEEVRGGSSRAYAQLYERHVASAYNMARQVAKTPAEADDLVSEAFAKVLDTLREGRGPTSAFRAYLLTSLRHVAYDRTRRERKIHLADDVAEVSGADVSVPFQDTATEGLERTLAAQAFARLPERWQTVLWHIEIEGQPPAEVAPLLGLTPNGVSALAYRAREGLRQAYLQVHLSQLDATESGVEHCRAAVDRLGAWTRSGLSKRETAQVETHLDGCDRCRALAAELAEVNGALRVIIAPLVLGGSLVGYLASTSGGATAAVTAGGAAGSAAAGGAAAGDAATAGPRQAITAGAATAVLAAAVAIALTSAGGQSVPVAQAPPAPQAPAPPAPPPPAPQPPAAPPPVPQPPPAQPPQAPTPAPAPAPAPPPPGAPSLNAVAPSQPVRLIAGGDPAAVPITLANNGTADSPPITSTMTLPPGVTGEMPSAASSGPASTTPQSVGASAVGVRTQAPGAPTVTCSSQAGLLTCSTDRGLRPGESMAFDYLVQADRSATGGEISVSISAGAQIDLNLPAVPVIVQPPEPPPAPEPPKPPEPIDRVDLRAKANDWPALDSSRIMIDVRNTGTSTREAEAVAQLPEDVEIRDVPTGCSAEPMAGGTAVTCSERLSPQHHMYRELWVAHDDEHGHPWWPWRPDNGEHRHPHVVTVPISAQLGAAEDHQSVPLRMWLPWWPQPPHHPPAPPTSEPSTPPPTTTSIPTGPECPPWWPPGHGAPPWPPGQDRPGHGPDNGSHYQHGQQHWYVWQEWDGWHCQPAQPDTPGNPPEPGPTSTPSTPSTPSTTEPRPSDSPAPEPTPSGSTPPSSTTPKPSTTSSTPPTSTTSSTTQQTS